MAEKFLRNQVAFGKQTSNMTNPTPDQVKRGVQMAVKTALTSRLTAPLRFGQPVVSQLIQMAKEIAAKELGKPGNASLTMSPLTASATARTRANTTLARRIETELLTFARGALGLSDSNLSSDQKAFSPQEKAYIKQVSADAATSATDQDTSPLGMYLAAAKVHIRISQIIARLSLDTRDEMGLPGTDIIRNSLSDADRVLMSLALTGNPFQGFGLRRTVIFAPLPIKPENDQIALQASPSFTYSIIRKLAVNKISSLITREKIIVLPENAAPPISDLQAPASGRLDEVLKQLRELTDQVKRNRFDNIIVIVPPGGFPENLGNQLESLRKRMALNPDVRLDIVQIDTGIVPERLRDLRARSRGSSLLAFDIDSFGAIGQRLRGEGLAGSWVIIPEQGHLDLTPSSQKSGDAAIGASLDPSQMPRLQPLGILRDRLLILNNLPKTSLTDELNAATDESRLTEARAHYLAAITGKLKDENGKPLKKRNASAVAYANLYNNNFFQVSPGDSPAKAPDRPKDTLSSAIAGNDELRKSMPSLATMRDDLRGLGRERTDLVQQDEFKRTVMPTIANLESLRTDLDNLDDALKDIEVKDPTSLKKAIDLTIKARRGIADLPRYLADQGKGSSSVIPSSEDSLYRSKAMRLGIERAILVRLVRFSDSQLEFQKLATDAARDQTHLDSLPAQEKEYQAYVELTRIFSQLFKNLHRYDATQATDSGKNDDLFAKLAEKLDHEQGDAADGAKVPAGTAPDQQTKPAEPPKDPGKPAEPAKDTNKEKKATGNAPKDALSTIKAAPKSQQYVQLLAEIYLDLFDLQNELSRNTLTTPTFARLPRKTVPPIVLLPQQPGGQGGAAAKSLPEQLLAETPLLAQVAPFDLKPFTAEEKASFDLIVGFTRELKPLGMPTICRLSGCSTRPVPTPMRRGRHSSSSILRPRQVRCLYSGCLIPTGTPGDFRQGAITPNSTSKQSICPTAAARSTTRSRSHLPIPRWSCPPRSARSRSALVTATKKTTTKWLLAASSPPPRAWRSSKHWSPPAVRCRMST